MEYNTQEVRNSWIIRFIIDSDYRILRHFVLLSGILAVIAFSRAITDYPSPYNYYRLVCIYGSIITMSYINMYFLVPRFFFKGRYLLYILLLLALVVAWLMIIGVLLSAYSPEYIVVRHQHDNQLRGYYEGTIILMPIILVTTMIKLFQRWTIDTERINELNNITLTMELNELRNQINPHFLFNMLNGIKALVRTDVDKASTVILQLSEFLRYQLYENNEVKIPLKSEIDFLSNFLELEKIRRDNLSVTLSCTIDPSVINNMLLPPSLFTIFVENAVKHSINISGAQSDITIRIETDGTMLCFYCYNSIDPDYIPSVDKKKGGLGLLNIKRRLDLLYGKAHTLTLAHTKSAYNVTLKIPYELYYNR